MKDKIFPIVKVDKNEVVGINGLSSFMYEIEELDFEQLTNPESHQFFNSLERYLNNLRESESLRFSKIGGKSYLQSSTRLGDFPLKLSNATSFLTDFFKGDDLYSNIEVFDDYINFNGIYRRILSVQSFSNDLIDHSLIPHNLDYIISFKKKTDKDSVALLERVRRSHQGSFLKQRRDVESEEAYSQAEDLLEDVIRSNESIFDIEVFIMVDAYSLKQLNENTHTIIKELSLRGIKLFIEGQSPLKLKTGLGDIFSSLIPGIRPSFKYRSMPDKTSHLARLLPISKSKLMNTGVEFSDTNDESIYFDFTDQRFKNKNILVSGSTGSGKSVFVNYLSHSLLDLGFRSVIIDKGSSYKKLSLYHDGKILESGINPMHFPNPEFLREFILSVVDSELFKKKERGLLLKEIKRFLELSKKHSFDSLLSYLDKSFKDISLYFEDLKEFINTGSRAESKILYIDFENYPKNQIAPILLYTLEYFKSIKSKDKFLVFDEAWDFLKEHSSYLDESFRTIRKSGAFVIANSQGISDFNGFGDLSTSIINNSFFKVLFPQEHIKESSIDDFDNEKIKSLEFEKGKFSEFYLKTQDSKYRKVVRLYLTRLQRELYHTEADESDRLYQFVYDNQKYFDSTKNCINSFVRLRNEYL